MLDVHRLRLLRELAAHGTIASVARACALTPSAVSQQLALLRREAGAPLLVRDGRRVVLTDAARVLVSHTERILAELEAAAAGVAALSTEVTGVLRLAAFPTAASTLVPPAIAGCRAAHPDLRILLTGSEPDDGIAALRSGRVDVLLVYRYNLLPEVAEPGVELTALVTESLLAAVPPTFGLPPGELPLGELREERWIAPHSDTALRVTLDRACGLAGFAPRIDFTSDDYTVLLALVSAGLGVTVVPQLAVEGLAADVGRHPIATPALRRTVSAAVRSGSAGNPAVAALLSQLSAAAAAFPLSP